MPPFEPLSELSAAARRVVELLTSRDQSAGSGDWLLAIHEDGSRGAELLQTLMSHDRLLDDITWLNDQAHPHPADLMAQVLTEARIVARHLGRQHDIGTEHLLAGLLAVDSRLADRWNERGIAVDQLLTQPPLPDAAEHHPLDVEPELRLQVSAPMEDAGTFRVMDAAANRCREGLRVIEDYVRFTLDDAVLSEQLKVLRHKLAGILSSLGEQDWIRYRDTPGDVGTRIQTPSERVRLSLDSLVQANCKRVEEALRTLEEFSKLRGSHASQQIESVRYRFYPIEQALITRHRTTDRLARASLYLLLTDRSCPRGLGPVAHAAIQGGVDIIQLREKEISDARRLQLCRLVREWTRAAGTLMIVNDRPDLAALVEADGVHLGQDDLPVAAARRIVGPNCLIGVSTHTIEQARRAVLDGADYIGVGPVFPSQTKQFDEFAGLEFVQQVAAEIRLPWYPIGGIDASNLRLVQQAGATRAAVSSVICMADNPATVTRELKTRLDQPQE